MSSQVVIASVKTTQSTTDDTETDINTSDDYDSSSNINYNIESKQSTIYDDFNFTVCSLVKKLIQSDQYVCRFLSGFTKYVIKY